MDKKSYIDLDRQNCKARTEKYIQQFTNILIKEGVIKSQKELVVNMGTEIEFNKVFENERDDRFDESPYRIRNLSTSTNPQASHGTRDEEYIPECARSKEWDKFFIGTQNIPFPVNKDNRSKFTVEPAMMNNTATLSAMKWSDTFDSYQFGLISAAYSQGEVISPVMTYKGIGGWMEKIPNTIVKEAQKHCVSYVDFTSRTHRINLLFPNSIHLSTSVSKLNPGYVNSKYKLFNTLGERFLSSDNTVLPESLLQTSATTSSNTFGITLHKSLKAFAFQVTNS